MAGTSTHIRIRNILIIGLAGLLSILLLPACAQAEPLPTASATTAPPTLPPTSTPTIQPTLTPTKTAVRLVLPSRTSTATASTTPTHTPFPRDLEHYFLRYDPQATPNLPPPLWSVSMWNIWGSIIPATPVEATPQFIAAPPPADLASSAFDQLAPAGCVIDKSTAYCDESSPISPFGCRSNRVRDPSWISFPSMPDVTLVGVCYIKIDYGEKQPEDLYLFGCAFTTKAGYIIKNKEDYVLLDTIEKVKELFVPIESATEALSYAQMMTGLEAHFDFTYSPYLLYLQTTIEGTHVTEADGSYLMNLYHTRGCGCEPYMTSEVTLQVARDGSITWQSARPVYFTTGFGCAD